MAGAELGEGVAEGVTDGMAVLEAAGVRELAEAVDLAGVKTPAIADAPTATPTTRTATMTLTDHCRARLAR
jgi:hypothetical protein